MHIEKSHQLGQEEAIRRIDSFLEELMRRDFPGGVTIKNPERNWSANVMDFSFKVKKFMIGTTIAGTIEVNEQSVALDSDLPGLVTSLVAEDKVREVIGSQLETVLRA